MKGKNKVKNIATKPATQKTAARKKTTEKSSATKPVAKKTLELSLHGWGVEIECASVDEKAFKRLTVDGVNSGHEFDKYLSGADMRTGGLNGYCSLYLDDKKLGKTIRLKPIRVKTRLGGNAKYLLVSVSEVKGDIRYFEIDGDFDKKQLVLDLAHYELSDGTSFEVVWLDYGSTETYDGGVSCKSVESFVLTSDGKRHPVIFKDE